MIEPLKHQQAKKRIFWIWLASIWVISLMGVALLAAWSVRHVSKGGGRFSVAQGQFVINIAEFPALVNTAFLELKSRISGNPLALLVVRKEVEKPYWIRRFPAPDDAGYLLFSGVDKTTKQAGVQLIRIADGAVIARWKPDWQLIYQQTTEKKFIAKGSANNLLAIHPLLLNDGDIIFNDTSGSLVRMSRCTSRPVWLLDEPMHHSNELDETGAAIWAPSYSQDGFSDNKRLQERIRDDALSHVSLDGHLLEKRSFVRILRDNGLQALLLGMSGLEINEDPIHLNEIRVAQQDSRHWKRGDLLISARHLSTIFLYRPSTNKIIWHQVGPWMNQHSVDFVDDHRISVFDNNVISGPATSRDTSFLGEKDINQVMVYDFDTDKISQPFEALLAEVRPETITAGRARLLADGGLFLEENNSGRIMRFAKDRLMWSLVNDYDDETIGVLAWSRYLTAEEARQPLQALAMQKCAAKKN